MLLSKGQRAPRPSPNLQHPEPTERKLRGIKGGGETSPATCPEKVRRGSRLRKGETRSSRRAGKRRAKQDGAENWQDAKVIDLDEYRRSHPATIPPPPGNVPAPVPATAPEESTSSPNPSPTATAPVAEKEQFHIWTLDDFSPEAIAKDVERWRKQMPTHEESRQSRATMERVVEEKRQKEMKVMRSLLGWGKKAPPPPTSEASPTDDEKCVHHMRFGEDTEPDQPFEPQAPRPVIQGSHVGSRASQRRAKAKAKAKAGA